MYVRDMKSFQRYPHNVCFGILQGTWLYSNKPFVADIQDYPAPSNNVQRTHARSAERHAEEPCMVVNAVDKTGRKTFTAGPDLKDSQHYPPGLGHAVVQVFLRRQDALQQAVQERLFRCHADLADRASSVMTDLLQPLPRDADRWSDADLDGIFSLL